MKKLFFLFAAITFASCQQKRTEPEAKTAPALEQSPTEVKATIKLVSNEDPVCKMSVANGYADTTMYEGKIYGFCNSGCKEEFLKEPDSYLSVK